MCNCATAETRADFSPHTYVAQAWDEDKSGFIDTGELRLVLKAGHQILPDAANTLEKHSNGRRLVYFSPAIHALESRVQCLEGHINLFKCDFA